MEKKQRQISVKEDIPNIGLCDKIEAIADSEGRSFSNLVLFILSKFVKSQTETKE